MPKGNTLEPRIELRGRELVIRIRVRRVVEHVQGPNGGIDVASLTGRQQQVFELLRRWRSNKEIAQALDLSERTVKFHVTRILAKTGLESRRDILMLCGSPAA